MNITSLLTGIREVVQILFFIVIATVTVLTYLKAKRTLLQPIRTEIFKEQLKACSQLLEIFSKGEIELRMDFHVVELFHANTIWLFDQYASHFFGLETKEEARPYGDTLCPTTLVPVHQVEKRDEYFWPREAPKDPPKGTPATRAAAWMQYKFEAIKVPKGFTDREVELKKILSSPLIPQALARLVNDFRKVVRNNVKMLGEVLTVCAQEMPGKYPNLEVLKSASSVWINNRLNEKFEPLEKPAKEISEFLRAYFQTDALME